MIGMLAAIPFDTLAFIALILIASFFRWISKEAEKTKRKSEQNAPQAPKPTRVPLREETETDEERVRRFLEALGQPTSSKPPVPLERRPRALSPKPADTPRARKIFSPLPPLTTAPPPLPIETEIQSTVPIPIAEPMVSRVGVATDSTKLEPLTPTAFPETSGRSASREIIALLSSQRGLRDAIILREIFGPPRSVQAVDF